MLQTNVTVNIEKFSFPVEVRVKKGTTVTWTNRDSAGHTVTSDAGAFGSALLDTGSSFSFTFDTVGRFPYHCAPHPSMTGTVVVE
ncbi:MAG: hypothetical protein COV60_01090 [Candidatus Magasanikbacteria bacterium CG11_big_fil_rev_8_21_14_0_20_43_7]|uniref:Blue (type 1) copper domain-containing protein n=1 Tax=Candidatus Magasanikbacteria bacterium CG11_big_fil_rev_8_21_14_0_20_43_7 TaxID=1974654 RepID=A0A2H0N330_9BACT|nr:MAG: hypothetical protein COV60_01090 [Candidatus Magasanikbacteria bacterium CG11_big_fil_rev_8_21_14_0_20_43_7]